MAHSRVSTVDWEADIYAHGRQLNLWPYSRLVSTMLRETSGADRRTIRVLEIGCGAGNNIWFLARSGFDAHGLDASQTAIDFAANRLRDEGLRADLRVGDLVELPYDNETFHYVIDRGALTQNSHTQIAVALTEARRVLLPGGKFLSFDLFGLNYPGKEFGLEVSHHCYDHFSEGYFRSVGLTSFFDTGDLRSLFGAFTQMVAVKIVETNESGAVLSEFFDVEAIR